MNKSIEYKFNEQLQKPVFDFSEQKIDHLKEFDLEVEVKAISLNPVNLTKGHDLMRTGKSIGKIVLGGIE